MLKTLLVTANATQITNTLLYNFTDIKHLATILAGYIGRPDKSNLWVIPCQINTKKNMTLMDFDETWFLHSLF